MTGRDLMMYILRNELENQDVKYIASLIFITEEDAASKFNVGVETIRAWYALDLLDGIKLGNTIFILADAVNPRII